MRLVILTAVPRGVASACIPKLIARPGVDIAMVVFSQNLVTDRLKKMRRDLRKIRRVGILGGLVGRYLRTWNEESTLPDIHSVAATHAIPVEATPSFNCEHTRELVRRAGADLGIALGANILGPSLFQIPRHGMINVHGDVLPRFRGGMSVVWPIYEGVSETGFTIHQIDRGVDTGPILHVERFAIRFRDTLKQTYRENVAEIQRRVPDALADVVARYEENLRCAQIQKGPGRTYTTPTLREFLGMFARHRELRRQSLAGRLTN